MAFAGTIIRPFQSRNFVAGLGLVLIFYGALGVYAFITGDTHLKSQESRLATATVAISRDKIESPEITEALPHSKDEALGAPPMHENITAIEPPSPEADASAVENNMAPVAGLFETLSNGDILPKKAEDGRTPFITYSAPSPDVEGKKLIALVIDDVGLSPSITQSLHSALPHEISFLVSAYANDSESLQKQLRQNGRELWLKIPFETSGFPEDDPGMRGILSRASLGQNMENFKWGLTRFSGYAGVAADIDTAFITAKPTIGALMKENFDRGLGFFEMNNSAPPQIKDMAMRNNTPYIRNEIKLHDPKWNANIREAATLMESIAQSKGHAIGILKPYPETIPFIQEWISSLQARNFALVPVSWIYKRNLSSELSAAVAAPQTPSKEQQSVETPHESH